MIKNKSSIIFMMKIMLFLQNLKQKKYKISNLHIPYNSNELNFNRIIFTIMKISTKSAISLHSEFYTAKLSTAYLKSEKFAILFHHCQTFSLLIIT